MKSIPLSQGKFAIVDDESLDYLAKYKWCLSNGYAIRRDKKTRKTIFMHREILNCPKDKDVDHKNHNKLDNRKRNIRVCSRTENLLNRRPRSSKSGYRGVQWDKGCKKWRAYIMLSTSMTGLPKIKNMYLGVYCDKAEAAFVQNSVRLQIYGAYAKDDF